MEGEKESERRQEEEGKEQHRKGKSNYRGQIWQRR